MSINKFKAVLQMCIQSCLRFFGFLICRRRTMHAPEFLTYYDGLVPPRIYGSTTLKLVYFFTSLLGTFFVVHSFTTGGWLSCFSSVEVIGIEMMGIFITHRLCTSLILFCCKWRNFEDVNVVEESLDMLGILDRGLLAAAAIGVSIACLYMYEIQISYVGLLVSIVIVAHNVVQKKTGHLIIGIIFTTYSALSLLLPDCCFCEYPIDSIIFLFIMIFYFYSTSV